jgi:hypothetical protein
MARLRTQPIRCRKNELHDQSSDYNSDMTESQIPASLDFAEREFVCDLGRRRDPVWKSILFVMLLGAIIGLAGWAITDRHFSAAHILIWIIANIAWVAVLVQADVRKPLLCLRVSPESLTVVRAKSQAVYPWREMEAARFRVYPIVTMGTNVECFVFRFNKRNTELLTGLRPAEEREFKVLVSEVLDHLRIPVESGALPSFRHRLSVGGAFTFILGAAGMLIATRLAITRWGPSLAWP